MDRPRPAVAAAGSPSTTFVQTDQAMFKELVQRLTGPAAASDVQHGATTRPPTSVRRPAFKPAHRPKLTVVKPSVNMAGFLAPAVLSPSSSDMAGLRIRDMDAPSPTLSAAEVVINEAEEEKAIRERRFYLHPSPRSVAAATGPTARSASAGEPELLPLFPVTSPNRSREA